ncbi:neuferricin-like [Strongylocentrotus purpuratus]|uniref:Cytochrome b5 heme-binding domain-containing protein n=1 Tax=Strongylocentrotus purpuratus TaxID=7668 RepID=A0A7M7P7F5_STRPU|nr:neuferricin-like [Strongylocentrotus purpuratus]|eukprot:XP_795139.1 PREDICTED: neuferricin-like [Strongylocentrotus purpuratus]
MASTGFVVGFLVAVIAFSVLSIIPDSDPRIVSLQSRVNYLTSELVGLFSRENVAGTASQESIDTSEDSGKLFTVDSLKAYDGSRNSPGLHIAIMGKVFDVSKGTKHYGPGGGYSFFAGRDGSKAYISGDFSEEGLTPDVEGLTPQDMIGLEDWVKFFNNEYTYVGKLNGHFYDERGEPTPNLRAAEKSIEEGRRLKANDAEHKKQYPPCNSEWKQATGLRVWCSNKSGGISRDWIGVPRKLFNPGTNKQRCACIKESELHNPHLRLYDNCPLRSASCKGDT